MAVKSIGNMRESVVFLQNSPIPKGAGFEDVYTTLLTTRGQLIQYSNNRGLSFGEITDSFRFTLRVRFQAALAASLRSDTKIVISGVTYTHSGFRLIDQKKHIYEFDITAVKN